MSLIPEFRRAAFGLFEHPFLRHGPFLLPRRAHLRQWMDAFETPEGGWIRADVREETGQDGRGVFVVEAEVPGAKKSGPSRLSLLPESRRLMDGRRCQRRV